MDAGYSKLFAQGMELRRERAQHLQKHRKFAALSREQIDAIRARHSADDIEALLLDVTFLKHYLDQTQDRFHETLDQLNDARRENAAMREIVQAVADKGGECWEAGDNVCLYCHARIQAGVTGLEDDSVPHTVDCPVAKARALLGTPQE